MKLEFFSSIFRKLTPISNVSLIRNLFGSFLCIFSYSILIYIIFIFPLDGDKASSLASMFGFSATLFAPVGAWFLVVNWKEQTKYNEQLAILASMKTNLAKLENMLKEIQSNIQNLNFFEKLLSELQNQGNLFEGREDKVSEWNLGDFSYPDFHKIYETIEDLTTKKYLLELYSCNFNNNFFKSVNSLDNFYSLKSYVNGLEKCFYYFKNEVNNEYITAIRSEVKKREILEDACFCSPLFFNKNPHSLLGYQFQLSKNIKLGGKLLEINDNIYIYRLLLEKK